MTPIERAARAQSAMQCLALDAADAANGIKELGVALLRYDAAVKCLAFDEIEVQAMIDAALASDPSVGISETEN